MNNEKLFRILLILTNCFLLLQAYKSDNTREINSLLVNDLNIIASKIDEIPETSLNIKLVLLAYECNDVKLNWKIGTSSSSDNEFGKSKLFSNKKLMLDQQTSSSSASKIFGYQIVVREIVDGTSSFSDTKTVINSKKEGNNRFTFRKDSPYQNSNNSEKSMRVYSSKFIDSDQNKFKLINLLRRDQASYHICLIIYIDVTETVAFEKQCVNFSLPIVSAETELACKAQKASKLANTKSSKSKNNENNADLENDFVDNENYNKPNRMKNANSNKTQKLNSNNLTTQHPPRVQIFRNENANGPNCEHVSQCRYYSNLLTAFVVCGVLLGTNIFMFTIIIVQNTLKLNFLRKKLHYMKKYGYNNSNASSNGTIITSSHRYTETGGSSYYKASGICCLSYVFKWAVDKTCSDVINTICLGNFKKRKSNYPASAPPPPPIKRKLKQAKKIESFKTMKLDTYSPTGLTNNGFRIDGLDPDCTRTITRPGYILNIPNNNANSNYNNNTNTIINDSNFLNVSNNTANNSSFFTRSSLFNKKKNKKQNKHNVNNENNFFLKINRRKNYINPFQQQNENLTINCQQNAVINGSNKSSDDSLISTSFLDHDLTMNIEYDKEIFYHQKYSNNNINNNNVNLTECTVNTSKFLNQSEISSAF